MNRSKAIIKQTQDFGANNYNPLPVVLTYGEGIWLEDVEGKRYIDMLSAYSAVNQGHRHPKIMQALLDQAEKITLTSRAFHNDQLGKWCEVVCYLTNKDMALPMNTGAEAVETAIKAARRYAYTHKNIEHENAEIIVCNGNFHGRTIACISLSDDPETRENFGPFLSGVIQVPYGDIQALKNAITLNTAAILIEPIQGEAGVIIPPDGYLKSIREVCDSEDVLFIADEIQTGLGRTGKRFACDWEEVVPDMYLLGKALGGGVIPISAICANEDILGVFSPGSHGSTFGGNPLACATSIAALEVIEEEQLAKKSHQLGLYFIEELRKIKNPIIREIRGRGLFIGIEFNSSARPIAEKLKDYGVLAKETHENILRFAPPLIIEKEELDLALTHIQEVIEQI